MYGSLNNTNVSLASLNPYEELGISLSATAQEIRSAYHKALLEKHPDRLRSKQLGFDEAAASQIFLRAIKAYEILSNEEAKMQVDQNLIACSCSETIPISQFSVADNGIYRLECRCGDFYEISQQDIAEGYNIVQCNGCSLAVSINN